MACALMKDEVQGDQEGGLHGEDGDASDDGEEPRHEGTRSNCCCNRATTFVTSANLLCSGPTSGSILSSSHVHPADR
jgi:hypothetical protein